MKELIKKELIEKIIKKNNIDIKNNDVKKIYKEISKDEKITEIIEKNMKAGGDEKDLKKMGKEMIKIIKELKKKEDKKDKMIKRKLENTSTTLDDIDIYIFAAGYVKKNRKKTATTETYSNYKNFENERFIVEIHSPAVLDETHKTVLDTILLYGKEKNGREAKKKKGFYFQDVSLSTQSIAEMAGMWRKTVENCIADMQKAIITFTEKGTNNAFDLELLYNPCRSGEKYYVRFTEEYMALWGSRRTIDYSPYIPVINSSRPKARSLIRYVLKQKEQKIAFSNLLIKCKILTVCEICPAFNKKKKQCTKELREENLCKLNQNKEINNLKEELEGKSEKIDVEVIFSPIPKEKIKVNKYKRAGARNIKDYIVSIKRKKSSKVILYQNRLSEKEINLQGNNRNNQLLELLKL